jgi:hypothetical protein
MHAIVEKVTQRIVERSKNNRQAYLDSIEREDWQNITSLAHNQDEARAMVAKLF